MSGESEEKNLPPSQQKLRKAREKGQVVTSRETLMSLTGAAVLAYLYMRMDAIGTDLRALFSFQADPDLEFLGQLADTGQLALRLMMRIVLPVLIGVLVIAILGGMVVSGGPVFSTHPLIPDFKKLSPASGFKKIFGRRALLTFLMHLIRLSAIIVVTGVLFMPQIGALVAAPPCGMGCLHEAIRAMLVPLLVATLAILILTSLLDYLVQRASFIREQRMSITEFKREMKDQEGDPLLKGQMRSDQQAMVERPTGLAQATSIIHAAPNVAVALRYVEGETPAPLVVMRARGAVSVARMLRGARNVRASFDAEAVEKIRTVAVGDYVVEDQQIQAIAPYLHPTM
ncbi:EscU/YscU/HrcU family type III secretion system export apparatus switch protein [Paracoccus sp. (in: a-proteobacteria)]|uniref:EscU/YscU/HrcU family type III secretion system export apparatus switch protein n=1 Tax=Paracoccus sp. TaxID=267 RepID=UPI003A8C0B32